jgi:hypothetical protein
MQWHLFVRVIFFLTFCARIGSLFCVDLLMFSVDADLLNHGSRMGLSPIAAS